MSRDLVEAPSLALELLCEELPRRYAHVVGVAARSISALATTLDHERLGVLDAAGVLHDIGYASAIQDTGFHPIDGGRHLRSIGFDERVVNLVANHTCAHVEAQLRGLGRILTDEFPRDASLPHDELCYCDLTTSPTGELITVEDRLADIAARYEPGSIVARFVELAGDELRATAARVEASIQPR